MPSCSSNFTHLDRLPLEPRASPSVETSSNDSLPCPGCPDRPGNRRGKGQAKHCVARSQKGQSIRRLFFDRDVRRMRQHVPESPRDRRGTKQKILRKARIQPTRDIAVCLRPIFTKHGVHMTRILKATALTWPQPGRLARRVLGQERTAPASQVLLAMLSWPPPALCWRQHKRGVQQHRLTCTSQATSNMHGASSKQSKPCCRKEHRGKRALALENL